MGANEKWGRRNLTFLQNRITSRSTCSYFYTAGFPLAEQTLITLARVYCTRSGIFYQRSSRGLQRFTESSCGGGAGGGVGMGTA